MPTHNLIKLEDYEDLDIIDIIVILEKSFAIRFPKNAFINVTTFGDLCDVVESYIKYDNKDDCTKQQAFYKIRNAISEIQLIDKKSINLDGKLDEFFPKHDRRRKVKIFQKHLGINLKLMTYSSWLSPIFLIAFLVSFIALFFSWKAGACEIVVFRIANKIADLLGKKFTVITVRELVQKVATENYVAIRGNNLTVNKNEIFEIIKETFSTNLHIDKKELTREARFGW